MARLMVILYDEVSAWLDKGEVVEGYFNPGGLFDRVDVVLTNRDEPDPAAAQPLAGEAELVFHNVPAGARTFITTAGWRLPLLRRWARPIVELARELRPDVVRCHGAQLNAVAASEVKRILGIPFVVSLHGNLDVDYWRGRRAVTWKQKLIGKLLERVEVVGLRSADRVLAVYQPIVPYLTAHGLDNYEVVYNAVSKAISQKEHYSIDPDRVRVLCVGRQDPLEKDPAPIIDAVADLPNVELTLVGKGGLHQELRDRAAASPAAGRINFVPAMSNEDVVVLLRNSDIFVYSSENFEISKACIEAALTGLPIVVNDRRGDPAPELLGGHVLLVDGSAAGYEQAISELIAREDLRESLGRAAAVKARSDWSPNEMEERVARVYSSLIRRDVPRL